MRIGAVYTSPLERAVETGEPIARTHGLEVRKADELGEMRVGEWEGLPFAELDTREDWRAFNTFRTAVRPPGGELMIETQQRMIRKLHCLGEQYANETIAVVSHADPLRAVIGYYLGLPLDGVLRLEISTASLSVVQADRWGARVLCVNQTEQVPV